MEKKYIDAEAAKLKVAIETAEEGAKNATDAGFIAFLRGFRTLFDANIDEMPAADVQEVRHGKWNSAGACSMCGAAIATDTTIDFLPREEQHYCYFCGAKMDGEVK